MNRKIILGAVLICSAIAFGILHFFTSNDTVDVKVDTKVETPAAEVRQDDKAVEQRETTKNDVKSALNEPAGTKEVKQAAEEKNDKAYIYIKKSAFMLYYIDNNGKQAFSAGCALGLNPGQKEKEGDMKTPSGTFYVDEILDASYWTHDFGDGKGEIKGAYGPWFISINTDEMSKGKWGGIGIHGTHDPASIGTRASEGCIRLENSQVEVLKKMISVGTKVIIEE